MHNNYRDLMEHLTPPAGLNDRVLFVVRQREKSAAGSDHLSRRAFTPVLRGAVCAACALALALGTVTLRSAEEEGIHNEGVPVMTLDYAFGLVAYAAELGEILRPNANGALAMLAGDGKLSREKGCYTGCLFQVEGENIEKISLSVDRGGLYRSVTRAGLTKEEVQALLLTEEEGGLSGPVYSIYGQDEDGPMNVVMLEELGASVTEDYDPAARYGFWVPPAETILDDQLDIAEGFRVNVDVFDGATLTVTIVFIDGTEQSKAYQLSTGRLKMVYQKDGSRLVLPQLAGDDEAYVYGIYAEDQRESRWFRWPVEGANTVSLSNSYGFRAAPGGVGGTFHAGIDIPAAQGTPVQAAEQGTVMAVGFDPTLGNYLVLDHGGGLTTTYGQCLSVAVEQGNVVTAGQVIAALGSTGKSTGPHLHFEVRQGDEAQNPVAYFDDTIRDTLNMG